MITWGTDFRPLRVRDHGNLAAFASPFLIGWLKDLTQSTDIGLYILTGSSLLLREGAGANRSGCSGFRNVSLGTVIVPERAQPASLATRQ
jgi:hypothetical protein